MLKSALVLILFQEHVELWLHVYYRDLTESAVAVKGDVSALQDHHLIYNLPKDL